MVRKTKKEAQATRTLILDAAKRVLLARGIARTSLLDVAKEAGVTRGAIYWHFTDKEHLLRSIWHHLLNENTFFFQIADRREESDPLGFLVEQLFGFLKKLPENTRHQRLFRLFLHEYGLGSGQGVSLPFDYMEFQKNRLRSVAALLSTAVEKRQLPAGIDVRLGAIALLAYVDGLVPQYQRLVDEMEMQVETPFLINGLMQLLRFGCISQVVSTPEPAAHAPE